MMNRLGRGHSGPELVPAYPGQNEHRPLVGDRGQDAIRTRWMHDRRPMLLFEQVSDLAFPALTRGSASYPAHLDLISSGA